MRLFAGRAIGLRSWPVLFLQSVRGDLRLLVLTAEPLDPNAIMTRLRKALDEAEALVAQMPTDKAGLLFLKSGRAVQPDPSRLQDYQTHRGQRRGHWPLSSEISAAMLEHYRKPREE